MMNAYILPMKEAVQLKPNNRNKTVMVRLLDPDNYNVPPLQHHNNFDDVLSLKVEDYIIKEEDIFDLEEPTLIGDNDKRSLLDFFNKHKDADNFIIHCTAGISRSSAVGLSLLYFLNHYGVRLKFQTPKYWIPNHMILTELYDFIDNYVDNTN